MPSKPATEEELEKTEARILRTIREGEHTVRDFERSAATLQYATGVSREATVRRARQRLEARGVIKRYGYRWFLTETKVNYMRDRGQGRRAGTYTLEG